MKIIIKSLKGELVNLDLQPTDTVYYQYLRSSQSSKLISK